MNFIWDMAILAEEDGIAKRELFFKQSKDISPWYEQSFSVLNQKHLESTKIELNALYRFHFIFERLLHIDLDEFPEFQSYVYDVAMHFLCDVDLYQGVSKREIYTKQLQRDLESIMYGEAYQKAFCLFSEKERNCLAGFYLVQLETGASLRIFRNLLEMMFNKAVLYQMRDDKNALLLYMDFEKSAENEQKMKWICDAFVPIVYTIRVFYKMHFAVFDVDATMELDCIEIF